MENLFEFFIKICFCHNRQPTFQHKFTIVSCLFLIHLSIRRSMTNFNFQNRLHLSNKEINYFRGRQINFIFHRLSLIIETLTILGILHSVIFHTFVCVYLHSFNDNYNILKSFSPFNETLICHVNRKSRNVYYRLNDAMIRIIFSSNESLENEKLTNYGW